MSKAIQKTEAKDVSKDVQSGLLEVCFPLPNVEVFTDFDCQVFGSPDVNASKCETCKNIDACLAWMEANKADGSGRTKKETDAFSFRVGSTKSLFAHSIYKSPKEMRGEKDSIVKARWNTRNQTYYDAFNELRGRKGKTHKTRPLAAKDGSGNMFILKGRLTDEERTLCDKLVKQYGTLLD